MTVTLAGSVQVDTIDLRAAFTAVTPHSAPNKRGDEVSALNRVRLIIDRHHVNVCASNGSTMALAQVSIEADDRPNPEAADDGPYIVDLPPVACRRILTVFKARRPRKDAPPGEGRIELGFSMDMLDVVEGPGGLWAGQRLGFPTDEPNANFPNVMALIGRAVREAGATEAAKPLITAGGTMHLFHDAARAYNQPLRVSGSGDTNSPLWLVECGESFVGALGSKVVADDDRKQHAGWRQRWTRVLPAPLKAAS